jgi:hypothetical protein
VHIHPGANRPPTDPAVLIWRAHGRGCDATRRRRWQPRAHGAGAMKRDGEREQQQQTPPPVSLLSFPVYDTAMLQPLLFVRKRPGEKRYLTGGSHPTSGPTSQKHG